MAGSAEHRFAQLARDGVIAMGKVRITVWVLRNAGDKRAYRELSARETIAEHIELGFPRQPESVGLVLILVAFYMEL